MLKYIILFSIISQIFSYEDPMIPIPTYPLLFKQIDVFRLIDQLLVQVRQMQSLINRTYDMNDRIPDSLRSYFGGCFNAALNTSRIEYSAKLIEVETTHIPQLIEQFKQAITLEQQFNLMNITDRFIADISFNVIKPSLLFVTEILDCFKTKFPPLTLLA